MFSCGLNIRMKTTTRAAAPVIDLLVGLFGTQSALAAKLGIRCASISGWRQRGKIPVDRCGDIERVTGGQVTRYDVRPDVFGAAPSSNLQKAG